MWPAQPAINSVVVTAAPEWSPGEAYLALPYFDALHRFMPALMAREGHKVLHVDVRDRPRLTGVSNYGFFDRLWVGILDLAGVWWLIRRRKAPPHVQELR